MLLWSCALPTSSYFALFQSCKYLCEVLWNEKSCLYQMTPSRAKFQVVFFSKTQSSTVSQESESFFDTTKTMFFASSVLRNRWSVFIETLKTNQTEADIQHGKFQSQQFTFGKVTSNWKAVLPFLPVIYTSYCFLLYVMPISIGLVWDPSCVTGLYCLRDMRLRKLLMYYKTEIAKTQTIQLWFYIMHVRFVVNIYFSLFFHTMSIWWK